MVTKEEFNNLRRKPPILIDFLEENGEYVAATFLKMGTVERAYHFLFYKSRLKYYNCLLKVGEWILFSRYNPYDLEIVFTNNKALDDQYLYQDFTYMFPLTVRNRLWPQKLEREG